MRSEKEIRERGTEVNLDLRLESVAVPKLRNRCLMLRGWKQALEWVLEDSPK